MADQRGGGIAWTDESWNPVRGCSRVSPGCQRCYAERQAARFAGPGQPYANTIDMHGRWSGHVRIVGDHLTDPLRWRRPRRVFVNSMSDLFHEALPDEVIDRIFAVMALCQASGRGHVFQILTKRAPAMRRYMNGDRLHERIAAIAGAIAEDGDNALDAVLTGPWPLPSVWLGVSVEDQQRADERIPLLLQTRAAVRWVSLEPLLEAVTLRPRPALNLCIRCGLGPDALHDHPDGYRTHGLDWIVVGGESGPQARPCDVAWIRAIRDECRCAGVPCFIKQLGSRSLERIGGESGLDAHDTGVCGVTTPHERDFDTCYELRPIQTLDPKGGNPDEWPADLRVRQFPRVGA